MNSSADCCSRSVMPRSTYRLKSCERARINPGTRVIGVSVSEDAATLGGWVRIIADRTLGLLGVAERVEEDEIDVRDSYVGAGYGHMGPEVGETLRLLASTEGLLLDPVYTGKAMTGMLDMVRQGEFAYREALGD